MYWAGVGVGDGGWRGGVDGLPRFGSVFERGSRGVVKRGWVGWAISFCLFGLGG